MEEIAYKAHLFDVYIQRHPHNLQLAKEVTRRIVHDKANDAIGDGTEIDEKTLQHVEFLIAKAVDKCAANINKSNDKG